MVLLADYIDFPCLADTFGFRLKSASEYSATLRGWP